MIIISTMFKNDGPLIYRVKNLKNLLKQNGINEKIIVTTSLKTILNNIKKVRLLIISRPDVSKVSFFKELFLRKNKNCKLFFDMDDLISSVHYLTLSGIKSRNEHDSELDHNNNTNYLAISRADCLITSTKKISNFYRESLNTNTLVVNNLMDSSYLKLQKKERKIDSTLSILYMSGHCTHAYDFSKCAMDLLNFINKNTNINLKVLGDIKKEFINFFKPLKEKVEFISYAPYSEMMEIISNSDIILKPLDNNEFNDAKSNIKYLEAAVCRKPVIVTAVDEFSKIIKNKENGILVSRDNSNWHDALEYALKNKDKLKKIGDNAYKEMKENWIIESHKSNNLEALIKEIRNDC